MLVINVPRRLARPVRRFHHRRAEGAAGDAGGQALPHARDDAADASDSRNITIAPACSTSAAMITGRRPMWSDRSPATSSEASSAQRIDGEGHREQRRGKAPLRAETARTASDGARRQQEEAEQHGAQQREGGAGRQPPGRVHLVASAGETPGGGRHGNPLKQQNSLFGRMQASSFLKAMIFALESRHEATPILRRPGGPQCPGAGRGAQGAGGTGGRAGARARSPCWPWPNARASARPASTAAGATSPAC